MEPQKNVVLVDQPEDDIRYYHTRFDVAVGGFGRRISVEVVLREGWRWADQVKATSFVRALAQKCHELGLSKVQISKRQITLIKYPAFEWEPIHQVMIETLTVVYEALKGQRPRVNWSDRARRAQWKWLAWVSPFYLGTALCILAVLWVAVVGATGIERAFVLASIPVVLAGFWLLATPECHARVR